MYKYSLQYNQPNKILLQVRVANIKTNKSATVYSTDNYVVSLCVKYESVLLVSLMLSCFDFTKHRIQLQIAFNGMKIMINFFQHYREWTFVRTCGWLNCPVFLWR